MKEPVVYDWGQSPNVPPSIRRVRLLTWIVASAFIGAAFSLFVLAVVWRPLLWLPAPPGPLSEHLSALAKAAVHAGSDRLFASDARQYSQWIAALNAPERNALIWRATLGLWCLLIPCPLLAAVFLRGKDGLTHLRGSTRSSGAKAAASLSRMLAARVRRRPDHDIAPGVAYPADLWTRHVLVVGGVGSGKSTVIKPLIGKVVEAGEQMLLFDPKSEFTMGFATPELVAPWDARSLSWDIAKDMRNPLDMRRFAAAMIKESQDPMWSNASRQLLVGLMIYLKGTRGTEWGWLELRDLLSLPQAKLLEVMRRWHPEAERAVEKASVTTAGILINLASFCSPIFDLAEAWGAAPMARRVSFVEWIQGRSKFKQIILQGHGAYAELTKSYVEGIVGVVSAMVNSVEMTDDPDRKIWFIADEFAQMGKMPVRPLFEVGRSRGVRCVVACQDFAQLEEIHGAPMVKALVGMCGTLLVGQIMQGETAEQLCKAFGSREVERRNTPLSGSGTAGASSFSREEVPLYKPSELTSRLGLAEDGSGVVLLLFTGGRAYELRWPIYKMRSERPPHVPAPWTLGGGAAWSRLPISAGSASTTAVVSADFDTREEQSELLAQSSQLSVAPVAETRKAEGGDEAIDGLGAHGVEREGKGTAKPDEEQTALWRAEDSIASRNERLSDASSSFDAPQTKNKECAAGAATLLANESFLERADHFGRDPEAHFDAAAELAALGLALGQRESSDMGNGEA